MLTTQKIQGGVFWFKKKIIKKLTYGSETLHMCSKGLVDVFEDYFADTCAEKFPLMSMGGQAECLARKPGSEDPPRREQNFKSFGIP